MDIQNGNCDDNIMTQPEISLQSAISSLAAEKNYHKLLENVKICLDYLSTFSISEVDSELLQWIMPVIDKNLQKIYEDNILLSDTADNDFVIDILKENLRMASELLQLMKIILDFVLESDVVRLFDIKNVTFTSAKVILSTYEHCKSSSEGYKDAFSVSLLDIFQKTQEVHSLYLKMLETCVVVRDLPEGADVLILKQVLEIICAISVILSDLNVKSMTMNWKGYAGIAQKFSNLLVDHINIELPIRCLTSEIERNLSPLVRMEPNDPRVVQVIRKTGFLTKVVLKISDIFWNILEKFCQELLHFCCIVYSYLPSHFEAFGHLQETVELLEISIFTGFEPFVSRLVINEDFVQLLSSQNVSVDKYSFGRLCFLNDCLKCIIKEESIGSLDAIFEVIFASTRQCFQEFSSPLSPSRSIFNNLVVHITAAVIRHNSFYSGLERILLENVLQEEIWCALLAMDVWCLLLREDVESLENISPTDIKCVWSTQKEITRDKYKPVPVDEMPCLKDKVKKTVMAVDKEGILDCFCQSLPNSAIAKHRKATHAFCMETLLDLVKIHGEFDFGFNTHRIEKVHLETLIRRVFGILPEDVRSEAIEVTERKGLNLWKVTGFDHHPVRHRHIVQELCTSTVRRIEGMDKDGFYLEDFIDLVEALNSLSSATFQDMGPNSKNLIDAIGTLWEFSYGRLSNNNVFNYFINKLCKMTRTLIAEFDNAQLFTILNQLKVFSTEDSLKLYVCGILSALAGKNTNEFGQDKFKIFSLMANVICPNLITSSNTVIKQHVLELIEKLVTNDKEDVVKDVMKVSTETNVDIVNYLQREVATEPVDREYFRSLGASKYQHQCIKWRSGNAGHFAKRIRLDEAPKEIEGKHPKLQKTTRKTSERRGHCQRNEVAVDTPDEDKTDVNEAIASIKGEVKSLMKVLKTEKLTQKNVSDLKMIANQLLSLM